MRIRKVEIDWGGGSASVDFRNSSGIVLPVCGILGKCGSGKTMLKEAALRSFRSASSVVSYYDWKTVNSVVEFDLGSAVASVVIKKGETSQKLVYPSFSMGKDKIRGMILFYDSFSRSLASGKMNKGFGEGCIEVILSDLVYGDVRDSVIWVDDIDLGLDIRNSCLLLQYLTKRSLEKNNQLIVSSSREEVLLGIGEGLRVLGNNDVDLVSTVLRGLTR
jgi:hypothetical protein